MRLEFETKWLIKRWGDFEIQKIVDEGIQPFWKPSLPPHPEGQVVNFQICHFFKVTYHYQQKENGNSKKKMETMCVEYSKYASAIQCANVHS